MAENKPVYVDPSSGQLREPRQGDTFINEPDVSFDNISDLTDYKIGQSPRTKTANVMGYYEAGDGGGGTFYWDSSESKANHNGGTIINPDHLSTIGSDNWYSASGNSTDTTGSGCWKRPKKDYINVLEFGAKDGQTSTKAIQTWGLLNNDKYIPQGIVVNSDNPINVGLGDIFLNGEIHINKHGYNGLVLDSVSDIKIHGSGKITGYGSFPSKTLNTQDGGGEKHETIDNGLSWPAGTGSNDNGLGSFGGGFIGNGGNAILIKGGCDNIEVDIETSGFNYSGVSVGDYLNTNSTQSLNTNIKVYGIHHDHYDAGVSYHACKDVNIDVICYEIGHPDAVGSDGTIDPGYGTTARLVSSTGEHARDVVLEAITRNCKRRGIDVHSGSNINIRNSKINNSFIAGLGITGGSGTRNKINVSNIEINDCGQSTSSGDAGVALGFNGEYDNSVIRNIIISGYSEDYIVSVGDNATGLIMDDIKHSDSSGTSGRPFYFNGISSSKITNSKFRCFDFNGSYTNSGLLEYTEGILKDFDFTFATFSTSSTRPISFSNCDIFIGENKWNYPIINDGNSGIFTPSITRGIITYDSTNGHSLVYHSGGEYISSDASGGSGVVLTSISGSDTGVTNEYEDWGASGQLNSNVPDTDLDYVYFQPSSSGSQAQIIISPRRNDQTIIATTSSSLQDVVVYFEINWGFQL